MTRSGRAFRLPRLVPHISAGGSSLWPTPSAQESHPTPEFVDEMLGNQQDEGGRIYLEGRKWHSQVTLSRAVQMWPTPTTSDGMGGPGNSGRQGGENLRTAVTNWPTPTTRDYKDAGKNTDYEKIAKKGKLAGVVGGQLNPAWVEWLMGFPEGWTVLED